MVLFFAEGSKVSERVATKPRGGDRVLEGDRGRQAGGGGDQEGVGVLCRKGPKGRKDKLDHARVPTSPCRPVCTQKRL